MKSSGRVFVFVCVREREISVLVHRLLRRLGVCKGREGQVIFCLFVCVCVCVCVCVYVCMGERERARYVL